MASQELAFDTKRVYAETRFQGAPCTETRISGAYIRRVACTQCFASGNAFYKAGLSVYAAYRVQAKCLSPTYSTNVFVFYEFLHTIGVQYVLYTVLPVVHICRYSDVQCRSVQQTCTGNVRSTVCTYLCTEYGRISEYDTRNAVLLRSQCGSTRRAQLAELRAQRNAVLSPAEC